MSIICGIPSKTTSSRFLQPSNAPVCDRIFVAESGIITFFKLDIPDKIGVISFIPSGNLTSVTSFPFNSAFPPNVELESIFKNEFKSEIFILRISELSNAR